MRLLMLNNEFPPLGGGTGTVNQALLRRLADVPGLAVDLVTSAPGRRPEASAPAPRIRVHRVPVRSRNVHHASNRELLTYAARALPVARRLHRAAPYDLALAWSTVPAGAVALALRRLTGLRYLVRVSGPDIPGFERRYGPLYPLLTPIIRATWRGAERVVAKCRAEVEMIGAVDPRVRVDTIPNGVDLEAFPPGPPAPPGGPLRLLCVGRLVERKGQHHLLEAVARLRAEGLAVTLDLVGTGDAEAALREQARRLGIADGVRFPGYVPREAIAACYRAADVFVLPSANEGMSVATLEAMAAGLPVVVTRAGGTAELVEPGVSGLLVDWGDVAALAGHLARLAGDRALARRMGAASRQRAAGFTWDAVTRAYLELFQAVAPGQPGRGAPGAAPARPVAS